MSRTAPAVESPDRGTYLAPGRSESADLKFGMFAALSACAGFWAVVALAVNWLIF